ncbi:MAG TPA: DUF72 domain-containing protein, partial [Candidatus Latescibacteria bacterium]|nr:DUF72 domain-containing protein [Candidatus Latescibacterota bacterium]
MDVKVGCCGFPRSKGEYYSRFKVVEIQKTFYNPPKVETAMGWREGAPDDLEFTLKAWQLITHEPKSPTYKKARVEIPEDKAGCYGSFRPTDEVFGAWARTIEIAEALRAKIIVFQCPASFKPTPENKDNMRSFFGAIKREGLTFAWEPRGKWRDEEIKELCDELNLIHIVDPFTRKMVYGRFNYFRLHGVGGYRYRYTNDDLKR